MTDEEWKKIISECEANAVDDSEIDTSDIPEITDFTHWYPGNPQHIPVRLIRESSTRYRIERVDGKDEPVFIHNGKADLLSSH